MDFKKLFHKKNRPITPAECTHIWKDFDWYIIGEDFVDIVYHKCNRCCYTIYEPYVCVCCKQRQNRVLSSGSFFYSSLEDYERKKAMILDKYHFKDKAILEDEITDFILVNKRSLELAESIGLLDTNDKPLVKLES